MTRIQNDRKFMRLYDIVCSLQELAADERFVQSPGRVENRVQLDAVITPALEKLSKRELIGRLGKASIAFGSLNSVEEFSQHPQLSLLTVGTTAGAVELRPDYLAVLPQHGHPAARHAVLFMTW